MNLVIVESPTKAKTISRFLGKDFKVVASFGHVRDLPKSKLGVDVEHDFAPTYTIPADHAAKVREMKAAAKKVDRIYFATDEDREGEAISWHIAEILHEPPEKLLRITFHEITKDALDAALAHPRHLDLRLVNAQQARRILDRLVGYELSPFLWRTVKRGLSAGRVQSVALRLIVERERHIREFVAQEYWSVEGRFHVPTDATEFEAKLHAVDGKTLQKFALKTKGEAENLLQEAKSKSFSVSAIENKERVVAPPPPFTTSTLQQEANRRLGFSAKQTMTLAQRLYEGVEMGAEGPVGLITYMRTDSVTLADKFLHEAKNFVTETYGEVYALSHPRRYKTKSKGAQEAHEAIRPTDPFRKPEDVSAFLDPGELRLYRLIWQRALATQMPETRMLGTSADLTSGRLMFRATGQRVIFDGYLKLYPDQEKDALLPALNAGQNVETVSLEAKQHFTEPPARYSDATLVKALEEAGIGRPSTYAPTISTLIERAYVQRDEKKRLAPTDVAFTVTDILVKQFPDIVDIEFTSRMEQSLDNVAEGHMEWQPLLEAFYKPFHMQLQTKDKVLEQEDADLAAGVVCDACGSAMKVKRSRFGRFLSCANYPTCTSTKPLPGEPAPPKPEPTDEKCPTCEAMMVKKQGRFGPFLSCSRYPECKTIKNIDILVIDASGNPVVCPKCKEGNIQEKRSKKGKVFFSCNRYPACDQAFWNRPTGELCPSCNYPTLTLKGKNKIACPSDTCDYEKEREDETA